MHRQISPYLRGDVLEVGAGLGGTSRYVCRADLQSWTAIEPDARLRQRLAESLAERPLPVSTTVLAGTTATIPQGATFDAVLYIDVLEHIDDDAAELARAAMLVRPGGVIVVLAPAHDWLATPFDDAIGHFRRYTSTRCRAITPPAMRLERVHYLDSVGMLLSLGNKLILRTRRPTRPQILFWDRVVVPISRLVDSLRLHALGKSVLAVYRKAVTC